MRTGTCVPKIIEHAHVFQNDRAVTGVPFFGINNRNRCSKNRLIGTSVPKKIRLGTYVPKMIEQEQVFQKELKKRTGVLKMI